MSTVLTHTSTLEDALKAWLEVVGWGLDAKFTDYTKLGYDFDSSEGPVLMHLSGSEEDVGAEVVRNLTITRVGINLKMKTLWASVTKPGNPKATRKEWPLLRFLTVPPAKIAQLVKSM